MPRWQRRCSSAGRGSNAILFGTLVIVTGPTVITPLLRRFKIEHATSTVLEAEGVVIDAVGAVVAVVALGIALEPSGKSFALGVFHIGTKLAVGAGIGFVGGIALGWLLRLPHVIPEGLETVFTLSVVLALFQGADALVHESGIAAATMAGIVVGNSDTRVQRELLEFKEQLTVMLIGMLFVILAASVRLADVAALGAGGLLTVAALVLVVRPLNVLVGTLGHRLELGNKRASSPGWAPVGSSPPPWRRSSRPSWRTWAFPAAESSRPWCSWSSR